MPLSRNHQCKRTSVEVMENLWLSSDFYHERGMIRPIDAQFSHQHWIFPVFRRNDKNLWWLESLDRSFRRTWKEEAFAPPTQVCSSRGLVVSFGKHFVNFSLRYLRISPFAQAFAMRTEKREPALHVENLYKYIRLAFSFNSWIAQLWSIVRRGYKVKVRSKRRTLTSFRGRKTFFGKNFNFFIPFLSHLRREKNSLNFSGISFMRIAENWKNLFDSR